MRTEDHEQHWNGDLKAARGVFGWPLIAGCILSFLIVVGISYLLDSSF